MAMSVVQASGFGVPTGTPPRVDDGVRANRQPPPPRSVHGGTEAEHPTPEPRTPNHRAGGHHLLVDLWVADPEPLRCVADWEVLLPDACRSAGATVLGARFHQFQPEGVTGIVLLAESHASVHTWPEAGLVTLDVFTCGALDAHAIVDRIRRALHPVRERVTAVTRGDRAHLGASTEPPGPTDPIQTPHRGVSTAP